MTGVASTASQQTRTRPCTLSMSSYLPVPHYLPESTIPVRTRHPRTCSIVPHSVLSQERNQWTQTPLTKMRSILGHSRASKIRRTGGIVCIQLRSSVVMALSGGVESKLPPRSPQLGLGSWGRLQAEKRPSELDRADECSAARADSPAPHRTPVTLTSDRPQARDHE